MEEEIPVEIIQKTVFVNRCDNYIPRNLIQTLKQAYVENIYERRKCEGEQEIEEFVNVLVRKKKLEIEIVGTVEKEEEMKNFNFPTVLQSDREGQLALLKSSDIFIYDIVANKKHLDDVYWAVNVLNDEMEEFKTPKMFILLSTVMTWAKSQPLDDGQLPIPFSEDDYRRRKAHPNFTEHLKVEKMVTSLGAKGNCPNLKTCVVAAGICYGDGEQAFFNLFKLAWENTDPLPVYGGGTNLIPTIYVKDLGNILRGIIYQMPKSRYIIAMDDSLPRLKDIVSALSNTLGTGNLQDISREEALLDEQLDQLSFDKITLNLRMEPTFAKESPHVQLQCPNGMISCMAQLVEEFKAKHNLTPFRVCVLGPPCVGKTTVIKEICRIFKLHHIEVNKVLDEVVQQMNAQAERFSPDDGDEDSKKVNEESESDLIEYKDEKSARYDGVPEEIIDKYVRQKLLTKACQNQGFILDGYPITKPQAKSLFDLAHAKEDSDDEAEASVVSTFFEPELMPQHVFLLEAPLEFLRQRVLHLDEAEVMATGNTDEYFLKRYDDYWSLIKEMEQPVNFFPKRGVIPVTLDATQMQVQDCVKSICESLGSPRNFGRSVAEMRSNQRRQEEMKVEMERKERENQQKIAQDKQNSKRHRLEEMAQKWKKELQDEYEIMDAQSLPMRSYLMRHVMPILTEGIINCVENRPDDPMDYLAEFLFYNNPLENLK